MYQKETFMNEINIPMDILDRIETLIYDQMYDYETAIDIIDREFDISLRQRLYLRRVYN